MRKHPPTLAGVFLAELSVVMMARDQQVMVWWFLEKQEQQKELKTNLKPLVYIRFSLHISTDMVLYLHQVGKEQTAPLEASI